MIVIMCLFSTCPVLVQCWELNWPVSHPCKPSLMYHVRFVKVPGLKHKASKSAASACYIVQTLLTVCNDLGEQFFLGDLTLQVSLVCQCQSSGQNDIVLESTILSWTAGIRQVEFSFDLYENNIKKLIKGFNATRSMLQLVVKARVLDLSKVIDLAAEGKQHQGSLYFMPLQSVPIAVDDVDSRFGFGPSRPTIKASPFAIRKLPSEKLSKLRFFEETGHSIAKHLWDAGVSTTEFLGEAMNTKELKGRLHLNRNVDVYSILELGTGCGLVGISLASLLPDSTFILTDLEDASEICNRNIVYNHSIGAIAQNTNVQFEILDWNDCESAHLRRKWDLVLVTDCTYNPSSYEALFTTLHKVVTEGCVLLLAHKFRNSDETVFFDQLTRDFDVIEDITMEYFAQPVKLIIVKQLKKD